MRKETVSRLPSRVWIEPTPSCNFKCGHCPNGMDTKFPKGLMDFDLFKRIVDELEGHVYDVNLFHRGESLIHPDLEMMVEYCTQKGMFTRLHTNAGLMTEERAVNLIDAGLSYVSFSVDGYNKDIYDKVRLGGNFDETVLNIQNFLRAKERSGKTTPMTILQVMEIGENGVGKTTRRKVFKNKFKELPLDRFIIRTPHNWAGDASEYGEGVADTGQAKFTPCTFLWYSMTVFFDGTIVPCPQDFYGKLIMGDLKKQSVTEVWEGAELKEMRKRMRQCDVKGLAPCEKCDILTRKTFMGVPSDYLSTFLKDNLSLR